MVEHFTEAIVLDKEDLRDFDSRICLYSRDLGKVMAKATSVRKIVSKLAAHLEPGNLIQVRLVGKNAFQIVDALKISSFPKTPQTITSLNLIRELTPEGQSDNELWQLIKAGDLSGGKLLGVLGFGQQFAACQNCGADDPAHFLLNELAYYCAVCFIKAGRPSSFALQ